MKKSYGVFEGDAAVWTDAEAWVLTNGVWHENESFKMWDNARTMSEVDWMRKYPDALRTLPKSAFVKA